MAEKEGSFRGPDGVDCREDVCFLGYVVGNIFEKETWGSGGDVCGVMVEEYIYIYFLTGGLGDF